MKTSIDPKEYPALAEGFQALSSPVRVAIVGGLMEREMDVSEIVGMLAGLDCPCSVERTNVSKHLAVLREAGIVAVDEEGQRRIYRLALPCLAQAFGCMAARGAAGGKSGKGRAECCA